MKPAPLAVAFREVRHFKPDDWLHVESVSLRGEALGWTIPPHRHEGLHQFHFLQDGAAEAEFDGRPQALQAPALLMVAPGCVHAFRYRPGSIGQQVTVPTSRLQQALSDAPALAARLPETCVLQGEVVGQAAGQLVAMLDALEAEFADHAPGRNEALQAHLVLLATWFLRRAAPLRADEHRRALRDTLVQRYRALVELHLRRHEPLGFYAEALRVTPDHLSRSCRAVLGVSALQLLHERLLLEARRLLAYTDAPVAAVAAELGFADAAYFSRFFARGAGQPPQAYRAALLDGTAVHPGPALHSASPVSPPSSAGPQRPRDT